MLGLDAALRAAEASSPVDALEAATRELGLTLGATTGSFVIADASARALVRLAHVPLSPAAGGHEESPPRRERRDDDESAPVMVLGDGPADQAVRTQTV